MPAPLVIIGGIATVMDNAAGMIENLQTGHTIGIANTSKHDLKLAFQSNNIKQAPNPIVPHDHATAFSYGDDIWSVEGRVEFNIGDTGYQFGIWSMKVHPMVSLDRGRHAEVCCAIKPYGSEHPWEGDTSIRTAVLESDARNAPSFETEKEAHGFFISVSVAENQSQVTISSAKK